MWKRVETDADIMGRGKRLSTDKVKEANWAEFVNQRF